MTSSRSAKRRPLLVTVVSKNRSTLEGLDSYLRAAGVVAQTTRAMDRLLAMTPPSAAAVILFPDEYGADVASQALAALSRLRPDVLSVVVTNDPKRFEGGDHGASASLVMAKPAWAWTILDAVRARLDGNSTGG